MLVFVFFFKQKTAYEMRISDWSSDVCSSDLKPMITALLGHALIATEDPQYFAEARQILRLSIARDGENPFAWYQLGLVYDREGDEPHAALATAERYNLEGNHAPALANAELAMRGLKTGTPDRSEEHTSELQSLMRISYAVFCLKKKKKTTHKNHT